MRMYLLRMLRSRELFALGFLTLPALILLATVLEGTLRSEVNTEGSRTIATACRLPTAGTEAIVADENLHLFVSCGGFFE